MDLGTAPKAQALYREFVENYESEDTNTDKLRTWDELSESEKLEWMEQAGEKPEDILGTPMYPKPIAKQGDLD